MSLEKRLARQLQRVNKTIQKLVARSKDFGELRRLLREEHVELAIYVVPMIGGRPATHDLQFHLTEDDHLFLKQAGIRIE